MTSTRTLLLMSLFFVDVHVRAESHNAAEKGECWGKVIPCVIQAKGNSKTVAANGFEMVVDKQSLAEQRNDKTVQLVNGRFLISLKAATKLATPYAEFTCDASCTGIFSRSMTEVTLKALSGSWRVRRLGEAHRYRVDAGLQVTVSEVTDSGMAAMEFPQSLPWIATVKEWAGLFAGESAAFKKEVSAFRESWREAVDSASAVHAADAGRSIASHQAALDSARARQKRSELEDQRLKELFRKKNHFD